MSAFTGFPNPLFGSRTILNQQINAQNLKTLAANRQSDIDRILKLFENFGLSANQDIAENAASRSALAEGSLISRGLANTTLREPLLGRIARNAQREKNRVAESVAGAKANFLSSQLIRPELITALARDAAAAGTGQPVSAALPAGSSTSRPSLRESLFGSPRPGSGSGPSSPQINRNSPSGLGSSSGGGVVSGRGAFIVRNPGGTIGGGGVQVGKTPGANSNTTAGGLKFFTDRGLLKMLGKNAASSAFPLFGAANAARGLSSILFGL